ncbi:MAG: tail fiber domain-containing protein [Bosea sp.]|nr:tail fiber domain-containing protein [Bosea sp. (in: a-proteobacteria)]
MGSKNSTSTSEQKLPANFQLAYNDMLGQAQKTAAQPFVPYTGGFEQDQQTAYKNIGDLFGSANNWYDAAAGNVQQAANANAQAMTPTYQTVGKYMSPYTDSVVNATMANIAEQNAQQQQGVIGNAIAKGAFGGDRVGVAQAQLARAQDLAANQTIADLRNQGYSTALGAAQNDKAAMLQAAGNYNAQAGTLGTLGANQLQGNLAQTQAQLEAGNQQQGFNYGQYQAERSYPFQSQGWLANILQGLGSTVGYSQKSTQPSGNTGSAILGGALSLASVIPWSDRRLKEGVIPVGETFDGQTIYKFRYKGEPETHIGLMAQEVEQDHPDAVGERAGYKTVDYDLATEGAERPRRATGGIIPEGIPYTTDISGKGLDDKEKLLKGYLENLPTTVAGARSVSKGSGILPIAGGGVDSPGLPVGGPESWFPKLSTTQRSNLAGLVPVGQGETFADGGYVANDNEGILPAYAAGGALGGLSGILGNLFRPRVTPVNAFDDRFAADTAGARELIIPPTPKQFDDRFNAATANARPLIIPPSPAEFDDRFAADTAKAKQFIIPPSPAEFNDRFASDTAGAKTLDLPMSNREFDARWAADTLGAKPLTMPEPTPAVITPVMAGAAGSGVAGVVPASLPVRQAVKTEAFPVKANVVPFEAPGVVAPSNGEGVIAKPLAPPVEVRSLPVAAVPNRDADPLMGILADQSRRATLPAGMRNNNPGNIKYLPTLDYPGIVGPSQNTDQGDPQAVFASPEAGMAAMYSLLDKKYAGGKRTAMDIIAGQGGWTPGNRQAAINVARAAGIGPNDDINFTDPESAAKFMRALITQEHGQAGELYPESMIYSAIGGANNPTMFAYGEDMGGSAQTSPASGVINAPTSAQAAPDADGILRPTPVVFGSGTAWKGLDSLKNPSDDLRASLLAAGLGMMAGTSGNFANNVGTGGLQGLEEWRKRKDQARESSIQQGQLGLEGKRVDIAAQQLLNDTKRLQAEIAQQTAQTAQTKVATQAAQFPTEMTPVGVMTRDVMKPGEVKLTPFNRLDTGAVTGGTAENAAALAGRPESAPSTPEQIKEAAQSDTFVKDPPPNIPINGMLISDMGRQIASDQTKSEMDRSRLNYEASQGTMMQLSQMRELVKDLPTTGILNQGAGLSARAGIVKHLNAALATVGASPIDPETIGSIEDLNKLSTRLGFELSRSMGNEAAQIVGTALSAVPSGDNTPDGFAKITKGIEAAAQRQADYYEFLGKWVQQTNGDITGAAAYFNSVNPPEKYLRAFGVIGDKTSNLGPIRKTINGKTYVMPDPTKPNEIFEETP